MKSNLAMKLKPEEKPGTTPPPRRLDAPLEIPFDENGFNTEETEYEVSVSSQLSLKNEASGTGDMTIYVVTENGQYSTSGLLGNSQTEVGVDNGDNEVVTVAASGTYLLSITAPPLSSPEPRAPAGGTIRIVVPS
jgi:hypothetical protein